MYDKFINELIDKIVDRVIEKLESKNNTATINSSDDTEYIPFDKMSEKDKNKLVAAIYSVKKVAVTTHTYERAIERGIPKEVIKAIKYCSSNNIIGLQGNGRLRLGIEYNNQVAVFIVCIEQGVATVITSWLTNIVNYKKYAIYKVGGN